MEFEKRYFHSAILRQEPVIPGDNNTDTDSQNENVSLTNIAFSRLNTPGVYFKLSQLKPAFNRDPFINLVQYCVIFQVYFNITHSLVQSQQRIIITKIIAV